MGKYRSNYRFLRILEAPKSEVGCYVIALQKNEHKLSSQFNNCSLTLQKQDTT